jgi:peroxisomal membrane protein 4
MDLVNKLEKNANSLLKALDGERDLLAALKGLRNGLIYGIRIRAPHALVMVFLFGSGRCDRLF